MSELAKKEEFVTEKILHSFIDTLPSKLNENEKIQFLNIAQSFGLNPYKREIHVVAYGSDANRQFSLITGYEVYLKRGERTGKLNGFKVWTEGELREDKIPVKRKQKDGTWKETEQKIWVGDLVAKVEIYRKDWDKPFTWEVEFSEYNQKNSMWFDKPKTMIKKVVVGQGFRLCFPDEFAGMPYLAEEIRTEDAEIISVESIPPDPVKDYKKAIIDALAEYQGDDKDEIRTRCNEAVKKKRFTPEFAQEIGKQLGLQL